MIEKLQCKESNRLIITEQCVACNYLTNPLLFFTDLTTEISSLCLLHKNNYFKEKLRQNKDIFFIDPGVYELKKSNEYSKIDWLHTLVNNLKENEYISLDYPCDMNEQYSNEFIEKTYQNNIKYQNNLQYIATIQCRFLDFASFIDNYNKMKNIINIPGKIIGLGNLCRILKISKNPKAKSYQNYLYCEQLFKFVENNFPKNHLIHVYGASAQLIEKYIKPLINKGFFFSVDSTKWTKAYKNWFKKQNGICCRKINRNKYFIHFLSEISISNIIF